jgi:hypothetical protein
MMIQKRLADIGSIWLGHNRWIGAFSVRPWYTKADELWIRALQLKEIFLSSLSA